MNATLLETIVVLVVCTIIFFAGGHVLSASYKEQLAIEKGEVAQLKLREPKIVKEIEVKYVHDVQVVTKQGKDIIREIPVYITKAADAACVIPVGFVRVHDAAASGIPLAEPAPGDNDAASQVNLSTVGETVTRNYTGCRANEIKVEALQGFITKSNQLAKDINHEAACKNRSRFDMFNRNGC